MTTSAPAPTRAQEIRRYVELDALSIVVSNLVGDLDDGIFRATDWDGMYVSDVHADEGRVNDRFSRLWPSDSNYEDLPSGTWRRPRHPRSPRGSA